jgi:hypothetical protein
MVLGFPQAFRGKLHGAAALPPPRKECEGGYIEDSKADNLKRVAEVGNGAPA